MWILWYMYFPWLDNNLDAGRRREKGSGLLQIKSPPLCSWEQRVWCLHGWSKHKGLLHRHTFGAQIFLEHMLESHLALFHCMWRLHFPRYLLRRSWASLKTISIRTQGSRYSHRGHADLVRYGGKWTLSQTLKDTWTKFSTLCRQHTSTDLLSATIGHTASGPHLRAMDEPGHSLL